MIVLIVGLGSIARKHISVLKTLQKDIKIYAFRSNKTLEQVPGVINIFHINEIPNNLDFVIISNPSSEHKASITRFMPFNKPLFIEKPVLSDLEESDCLLKQIQSRNLSTYVACNMRFHPAIQFLKKNIQTKRLLEYNSYCGSYLPDWRPGQDYKKGYSARKELGGGVHLDLIHEIDLCLFLLGNPEKSTSYLSKKSNLEISSMDVAHYILEYPEASAFITLNYYRKAAKREIECVWEDSIWSIDLLKNTIIDDKGEIIYKAPFNILDTYEQQMKYFIEMIELKIKPMNDFSEALEVLKICINEE